MSTGRTRKKGQSRAKERGAGTGPQKLTAPPGQERIEGKRRGEEEKSKRGCGRQPFFAHMAGSSGAYFHSPSTMNLYCGRIRSGAHSRGGGKR